MSLDEKLKMNFSTSLKFPSTTTVTLHQDLGIGEKLSRTGLSDLLRDPEYSGTQIRVSPYFPEIVECGKL